MSTVSLTWRAFATKGISLLQADDFETWILSLEILGESVYEGEKFALKFRFDTQYPISSPAVQFVVNDEYKPPVHPHVYTNGHRYSNLCLSTEHAGFLQGAAHPFLFLHPEPLTYRESPEGNDRYVRTAPDNPKKTQFIYDGLAVQRQQQNAKFSFSNHIAIVKASLGSQPSKSEKRSIHLTKKKRRKGEIEKAYGYCTYPSIDLAAAPCSKGLRFLMHHNIQSRPARLFRHRFFHFLAIGTTPFAAAPAPASTTAPAGAAAAQLGQLNVRTGERHARCMREEAIDGRLSTLARHCRSPSREAKPAAGLPRAPSRKPAEPTTHLPEIDLHQAFIHTTPTPVPTIPSAVSMLTSLSTFTTGYPGFIPSTTQSVVETRTVVIVPVRKPVRPSMLCAIRTSTSQPTPGELFALPCAETWACGNGEENGKEEEGSEP
ncbi:hypothetical protein EW146_g485 [Bondarzewia mesenterica]|uniref:UBC core domain-containing protein n=1 Tax=Bondarzewia mesenterica TaxID=1095465 RepID=A0A4S4M6V2_9AGAM|nr:hypothetical protein EW146_g485 [Bondarzewia mesenterica]